MNFEPLSFMVNFFKKIETDQVLTKKEVFNPQKPEQPEFVSVFRRISQYWVTGKFISSVKEIVTKNLVNPCSAQV